MTEPSPRQDSIEDDDGFLVTMTAWSREIAEELARKNNIGPLTEDHWKIIEYVKEHFMETGIGPPIVKISRQTGFSSRYICTLFPCGVAKGAYRLAGLPRPHGCL
ncbi:MAG: TusE/DsrC/DsvC family sulfur relay protein [Candidatus Zixiibacteriota bacterium]|nr:MAG: TusE/DsrC/DsvC family sulfur relay protein [candidate division Zixibacteria bacterium]